MHNIAEIERKCCPVAMLAVQKGPMHRQKVTLDPDFIGKPVNGYYISKRIYVNHRSYHLCCYLAELIDLSISFNGQQTTDKKH